MAFVRSRGAMLRLLRRALPHEKTAAAFPVWGCSQHYPGFGSHVSWSKEGNVGSLWAYDACRSIRSILTCSCKLGSSVSGRDENEGAPLVRLSKGTGATILLSDVRSMSTQARVPTQALRQGGLQVTMLSPGFVYEPYKPRERIPFWRRWFTPSGWRRTKEDMIMEINILLADGDKASLRKLVTENMFSAFKNELKRRESIWKSVYWELVEPAVKIRTLRARMIGVDKNDLGKAFIQLTLEFLTKQDLLIWYHTTNYIETCQATV